MGKVVLILEFTLFPYLPIGLSEMEAAGLVKNCVLLPPAPVPVHPLMVLQLFKNSVSYKRIIFSNGIVIIYKRNHY